MRTRIFRATHVRGIVLMMTARTIVQQGHPVLRHVAKNIPSEEIGSERIRTLIADMKTLLSKEKYGVALAAPQVGEPLRLFIVSGAALAQHEAGDEGKEVPPQPDQVYINPELIKISRTRKNKHEGCLSVRGFWGVVPRAEKATVRALDEHGNMFTRGASGFLAHIFQHELDHLDGILYLDKAKEVYEEKPEATEAPQHAS